MISLPIEDEAARGRPLPGDDRLADAGFQVTHGIVIDARPSEIWPRILDMVRRDAPAPLSQDVAAGVSVLLSDEPRALVLGALYDHAARSYVPFDGPRPAHFWQATWALVLEPLDAFRTRVLARARVAYTFDAVQWSAVWMHPFNDFIDHEDLRRLKARAEGVIAA